MADIENSTQNKGAKRWLLLLLMLAAFAVTFMTRFIWSPLNATVSGELGLSNLAAGSFMSAFFIGYVITQIPGGTMADRFGVKYVLSIGVLITGLATICMSFIGDYTQGMVFRVLTGLGAGVVMSCCTKVISEYFAQEDRGIAFGILLCGPTLGLTIANKMGAAILVSVGWQAAFQITGAIAIAIAVLIVCTVKNFKSPNAKKVTLVTGFKAVFTTRNLVAVCFAGFFYMFLNLGVSTWANKYLTTLGFTTLQAANVMTIYSIGGIVGSLLTGVITKKFHISVKAYLIGVYVLIAVLTVLFGTQTDLTMLTIIGCIYGFATYLPNAHLNALTTKYAPEGLSASCMGVQNTVFQLASIFSPMFVGWTVDASGNFNACWYAMAGTVIIGLVFLFILNEKDKAATKEAEASKS